MHLHGLRAIVNLRGPNPHVEWYQEERSLAQDLGVDHYDLPMSAGLPPTSGELKALVEILHTCKKPVLLHCESGAERTGLACAIYLLAEEEVSFEEVGSQMSLRFGVLPWKSGSTRCRRFLDLYRDWLTEQALEHSGEHFREWATTVYRRPEWLGGPDWPRYPP